MCSPFPVAAVKREMSKKAAMSRVCTECACAISVQCFGYDMCRACCETMYNDGNCKGCGGDFKLTFETGSFFCEECVCDECGKVPPKGEHKCPACGDCKRCCLYEGTGCRSCSEHVALVEGHDICQKCLDEWEADQRRRAHEASLMTPEERAQKKARDDKEEAQFQSLFASFIKK